ncbi:MAG: hypothetical protein ACKVS6_02785 [Planctomycetota bacterium]
MLTFPRNTAKAVSILSIAAIISAIGFSTIASPPPPAMPALNCTIDVDKELWIRDLSVVEDPVRTKYVPFNPSNPSEGIWTFGRFMENMAGANNVSKFVLHLFEQIRDDVVVNGFTVPGRPSFWDQIIQPWIDQSEANGIDGLDFTIAPFRLNGFVNRIDLRTNATYGGGTVSAGEGRIVFTITDIDGNTTIGTLIMEYRLLANNCEEVKKWAEAWHYLGSLKFGDEFNKNLQEIVEGFAGANADPNGVNGSALNQLRTNEVIAGFPWQWREFQLSAATTLLEQSTVAQTPDISVNHTKALRNFVNQNEAAILANDYIVPLTFAGQPFRGGVSDGEPYDAFYEAPGILNNEARHIVSLNTCVGCHSIETGVGFFHSTPRSQGQETFLSGFLTGITTFDPVSGVPRSFNDLKRRVDDLCKVLTQTCADFEIELPFKATH